MSRLTNDAEPSTSPSLLQRATQGDVDSWRRLAQVYGPIVYAWARRSGCQSADAADVMQDTFAAVAKALPRFDHERTGATFRGWLWTITRNKIRDHVRAAEVRAEGGTAAQLQFQQVAEPEIPTDDGISGKVGIENAEEPPSQVEADLAAIRGRTIEMLRDRFDPRSWRMFWETTIQGRDPADVAEEMSVSRWAVYKARARVLNRLQQEMRGLE